MPKKFEEILDECLDRVVNRGEDINQCLRDYPEAASEIEPLLRTALTARAASDSIQPRQEFKSLAKQRLLAEVRSREQKQNRTWQFPFFGWAQRWAVAAAAVLLVLLVGGGGTVVASANSMPDDFLYPVKTFIEDVRMTFAGSDMDKAELAAKFADRRVEEIAKMAEEGKADKVEKAAERLSEHLERIARVAAKQKAKDDIEEEDVAKLRDRLTQYATDHPLVLEKALEMTSAQAKTVVHEVLDTSQERYTAAIQDFNSAVRLKAITSTAVDNRTETVTGIIRRITDDKWLVGSEVVNIDAKTNISGTPKIGAGAKVAAKVNPDGSLRARKIVVRTINLSVSRDAVEEAPRAVEKAEDLPVKPVEKSAQLAKEAEMRTFRGIIREITDAEWTVGNRSVIVDANTVIEGSPQTRRPARVWVLVHEDGSLLARKIVVEGDDLPVPKTTSVEQTPRVAEEVEKPTVKAVDEPRQLTGDSIVRTFTGEIKRISDTEWIIGDRSVPVLSTTVIEGVPEVGLTAEVTVQVQPDGSIVVRKIKVNNGNVQTETPTRVTPPELIPRAPQQMQIAPTPMQVAPRSSPNASSSNKGNIGVDSKQ